MKKVTKEITFDCAHMLSNYDGKCNNLHGHTYKVRVQLEGDLKTEGSQLDMLVDFNELKSAMQLLIMDKLDHALVISGDGFREKAEDELLDWAMKYNKKVFVMPRRTTAEQIAQFIKTEMHGYFKGAYNVIVQVWETPTSYAEEF